MQDSFILTFLFLRHNFKNVFKENNWLINTIITELSLLESSPLLSSQPRLDYYRWHSQTSLHERRKRSLFLGSTYVE